MIIVPRKPILILCLRCVLQCYCFIYRCPKKCFEQFDETDRALIFDLLYNLDSKNEQDLHLQRMIEKCDVKQRRPRKGNESTQYEHSFKYHVLLKGKKVQVCRVAFFRLYDVSDKKIRRIRNLLKAGETPRDKRGRTSPVNKKSPDVLKCIHDHIESFPQKKTHYGTKEYVYLSSELTTKKMYDLFIERFPSIGIKYEFFLKYFNENFNLKFGKPQIDTCAYCEEREVKLKSPHINDNAKRVATAELMVHRRRAKQFHTALKNTTKLSETNENIVGLVFDFMQNIDLPKIPVQEVFYLRQLTVQVFCIYNTKTKLSHFYVYHEGKANKGSNDVTSFLMDYMSTLPSNIEEIHLFSDNCWGQNKNHTLSKFCLALCDLGKFKVVKQFFPLRGHSYNPCDRSFSMIKRPMRKQNRIFTVKEICELIVNSSKKSQCTVNLVETEMITDFCNWWPTVYKKTVISEETKRLPRQDKQPFVISKFYYFQYSHLEKGTVIASMHIRSGEFQTLHTFNLKKSPCLALPDTKAYPNGFVPIKKKKIDHLRKLYDYIPNEHIPFYDEILNWETTDEEVDVD